MHILESLIFFVGSCHILPYFSSLSGCLVLPLRFPIKIFGPDIDEKVTEIIKVLIFLSALGVFWETVSTNNCYSVFKMIHIYSNQSLIQRFLIHFFLYICIHTPMEACALFETPLCICRYLLCCCKPCCCMDIMKEGTVLLSIQL